MATTFAYNANPIVSLVCDPPHSPQNPNTNEALTPELWSLEALDLFYENNLYLNLVWRDIGAADDIRRFGDILNISRPRKMVARRKVDGQNVTRQAVGVDNVQIKLDQNWSVAFIIYDNEENYTAKSLMATHLVPAVDALKIKLGRTLVAQAMKWIFKNRVGRLGTAVDSKTLLAARKVLNKQNAPLQGRMLGVTCETETDLLNLEEFRNVDQSGDNEVMREAIIGKRYGWMVFMDQLHSEVTAAPALSQVLAAAGAKGATTITVDGGAFVVGQYITVDGLPFKLAGVAGTTLTLNIPLDEDIANGAEVLGYSSASTVDQSTTAASAGANGTGGTGYRAEWHDYIVVDGALPEIGQLVSFGAFGDGADYVVTEVDVAANAFEIDRPLEAAAADDAVINYGPAGNFNFGFLQRAIAFITRPLQPAMGGTALSAVRTDNGVSIRVTIDYDSDAEGHKVNLSVLSGLKDMYDELGVVVLG